MFVATLLAWFFSLVILWAPFFYDLALGGTVGHALLMGMIPFMMSSLMFMGVTQISHIQSECQSDETSGEVDYFKRQARTSMDYSTSSPFVGFMTGHLNVQSLHHTLPSISSAHYRALYPGFHALCVKHGCEPPQGKSIAHVMSKHLGYVWNLGSEIPADDPTESRGRRPPVLLV